ncbi:MAG TPA: NfeD family protein [Candidatus Babeliales bacterium]|nr:NfeD family protein [Candidatus Babeliales bacterium]
MSFLFFIFFLKIIVLPAINSTIYRSNTAALLGKTGVVIKDITEYQIGQIVVNGQVWSAHSSNKNLISIGTSVLVESIIGCHLVVREKVNFIER